jgi:uncharacterized protein
MSRNLLTFAVILGIIIALAYYAFSNIQSRRNEKTADIHGHIIQLEVADTPQKQTTGLSQRSSLAQDRGMLFVFQKPDNYSFWMKDMRFPIDIIFLKGEKVVSIYNDIQPQLHKENAANLTIYSPEVPSDRVIEINAGLAKKYGLKVNDIVKNNF